MQYDYGIRIGFRHRFDKLDVSRGHIDMRAVEAFRFVCVRKTRKDYRDVRFLSRFDGFRYKRSVHFVPLGISVGVNFVYSFRRVPSADHLIRIDMRAAAALMARSLCEFTDKCVFLVRRERQYAVVFQKHHTFRGYLAREFVIRRAVVYALRPFASGEYYLDYTLAGSVEYLLVELARFHRFDYLAVVLAAARRHFEFQSRFKSAYAIRDSAPVRHHKAVEAPFVAKNVVQ